MAFKKVPHIPADPTAANTVPALTQVVRYVTAQSQTPIATLPTTATAAEVLAKVNEIINRLQGN
jgi:hypothetical protein